MTTEERKERVKQFRSSLRMLESMSVPCSIPETKAMKWIHERQFAHTRAQSFEVTVAEVRKYEDEEKLDHVKIPNEMDNKPPAKTEGAE